VLDFDRSDYPVLKGISRSAGGAVLTVDIIDAVLEKRRIVQTPARYNKTAFQNGEYVISIRLTRKGQVGRVKRASTSGASTLVEFGCNKNLIEKLNSSLRVATDSEVLAARLKGLL
jgi:hypothetical protein